MMIEIVILFVVILCIWTVRRRSPNSLPGPLPLPGLGNVLQVLHARMLSPYPFSVLSKRYGDAFQIELPTCRIALFSSLKSISTVANIPESRGRYREGILADRSFGYNAGVIFSEGHMWEQTSRWVSTALRDCGFGKSATTESAILNEMTYFRNNLNSKEVILRVHGLFLVPALRIMYSLIAGQCTLTEEKMEEMKITMETMNKYIGFSTVGSALTFLWPGFRHHFPNFSGKTACANGIEVYRQLSEQVLNEAKNKVQLEDGEAETFAETFARQSLKLDSDKAEIPIHPFHDVNFHVIFQDLLQAGSHNTANIVDGFILFMILFPAVQQKVNQEILKVIGAQNRNYCTFEDRLRMPYTRAVLLEIHRILNILPILLPRKALGDFVYDGHIVKKDTFIIFDVSSVYTNPENFKNPHLFNPERFIDSKGNFVDSKYVIPFGLGRRSCPGAKVGEAEVFLVCTSLVRDFHILPVPGEEPPPFEMEVGFTARPKPFDVFLRTRDNIPEED